MHGKQLGTGQEDVLEIEAEDVGGTSLLASLLTTLSSQHGNGYFRPDRPYGRPRRDALAPHAVKNGR